MSAMEQDILAALRRLQRQWARVYAKHLALEVYYCESQVRAYLRRLEAAGLVERPGGRRGGWVVV